mmetsp:Transcript_8037/g.19990  ORF Transcript_8037/g.19990 Transcript_8037/m.19990 type:complete len:228 (-) Transcript_8037:407-1090(-)
MLERPTAGCGATAAPWLRGHGDAQPLGAAQPQAGAGPLGDELRQAECGAGARRPDGAHNKGEDGGCHRHLRGEVALVEAGGELGGGLAHDGGEEAHRHHGAKAEGREVGARAEPRGHGEGGHHPEQVSRAGAAVQDARDQRRRYRLVPLALEDDVQVMVRVALRRAVVVLARPLARLGDAAQPDDHDRDPHRRLHVRGEEVHVERASHREGQGAHERRADPVAHPPV